MISSERGFFPGGAEKWQCVFIYLLFFYQYVLGCYTNRGNMMGNQAILGGEIPRCWEYQL